MDIGLTLLKVLEYMIAGLFTLSAVWYKNKLDKRRKEKEGDDLSDDYVRKSVIKPVLDELRYQMEADRVEEWVASNGDTSLSGHHLKKLSMFMESHRDGIEDISQHFQLIPVQKFARHIDALSEAAEGFVIFHEEFSNDELGALATQYNIKTRAMFKVTNELGKWVGILSLAFEHKKELTPGEIAFCLLQAARIGAVR